MLDNDNQEEYIIMINKYKLRKISNNSFKNFFKYQSVDDNFIFEMLSKCLLKAHENYLNVYNKELGVRNMYNMDSSVDNAYKQIFKVLLKY
jgi:hypothetical protein